jgi:hypothetical protein
MHQPEQRGEKILDEATRRLPLAACPPFPHVLIRKTPPEKPLSLPGFARPPVVG